MDTLPLFDPDLRDEFVPSGKIYSPSQTTKFLKCQLEWWLSRQKWEKRYMSPKHIAGCVGSAFSIYMEKRWTEGTTFALAEAHHHLKYRLERVATALAENRSVEGWERSAPLKLDMCVEEMERCLERGFNGGVSPKTRVEPVINFNSLSIFRQEEKLEEFGYCIPDYIGSFPELEPDPDTKDPDLIVIDWKTKNKVDNRSISTLKEKFEISWQLKHYAWAVEQWYGRRVSHVGVAVIVMAPDLQGYLWIVPVNHDFLYNIWLPGARSTWAQMERIHNNMASPSMADIHYAYDGKGKCEYHDLCFKCGMDTDLAGYEGYTQIEGRL